MPILSQDFYVIIGRGISALGHGREVLYVINAIDERFLLQLISTVKLPGEKLLHTDGYAHWKPYIYWAEVYQNRRKSRRRWGVIVRVLVNM